MQVAEKYQEIQNMLDAGTIELAVSEPIPDASGKFVLPFDEAGNPTAWAQKSLTAQAGAEVVDECPIGRPILSRQRAPVGLRGPYRRSHLPTLAVRVLVEDIAHGCIEVNPTA